MFDTLPANQDAPKPTKYCSCQPEPRLSRPVGSPESDCARHGDVALSGVIPALDVTAEYIFSVELRPDGEENQQNRGTLTTGGLIPPGQGASTFSGVTPRDGGSPPDGASTRPRHPAGNRGRRQSYRYPSAPPPHQSLSQADPEGLAYFFPEDHEPAPQPDSPSPPPTWPTPSGLTQRQARAGCQRAVAESGLALGCGALLGRAFVGRALAMCVIDLQLKDDLGWLNATLPLLENECERRLVEERRSEGEHQEVLELLRCPGRCSGNGRCSDWGCLCYPGFGSYDCSAVSGRSP